MVINGGHYVNRGHHVDGGHNVAESITKLQQKMGWAYMGTAFGVRQEGKNFFLSLGG